MAESNCFLLSKLQMKKQKNSDKGQQGVFRRRKIALIHASGLEHIFFLGIFQKVLIVLLQVKVPIVSASKFRKKKKLTVTDWLSDHPIYHISGHIERVEIS